MDDFRLEKKTLPDWLKMKDSDIRIGTRKT
jgi:hypothetical protein